MASKCLLQIVLLTSIFAGLTRAEEFQGHLEGGLQVSTQRPGFASWHVVESGGAATILDEVAPAPASRVYVGRISLGTPETSNLSGVISLSTTASVFYLDLNHDGKLAANERFVFKAISSDTFDRAAKFHIPVPKGPFRNLPVEIRLFKPGKAPAVGPEELPFVYTNADSAFVTGHVPVRGHNILVRYQFDCRDGAVSLAKAVEWMDTNGDGLIYDADTSPERGVPVDEESPLFRIGQMVVRTVSVDVGTKIVTLQTMPDSVYQRFDLLPGSVVPNFGFVDFSGKQRHLSDVGGKYKLIDFWATWCGPCLADLPKLKQAYERFHRQGFEILGINGDEDLQKPVALLAKLDVHWPQAKPDRNLIEKRFQVTSWPTLILLDSKGRVVSDGSPSQPKLDGRELESTLRSLMNP